MAKKMNTGTGRIRAAGQLADSRTSPSKSGLWIAHDAVAGRVHGLSKSGATFRTVRSEN
jgi:hypothetical protein